MNEGSGLGRGLHPAFSLLRLEVSAARSLVCGDAFCGDLFWGGVFCGVVF